MITPTRDDLKEAVVSLARTYVEICEEMKPRGVWRVCGELFSERLEELDKLEKDKRESAAITPVVEANFAANNPLKTKADY